jgi:hypothetical protein
MKWWSSRPTAPPAVLLGQRGLFNGVHAADAGAVAVVAAVHIPGAHALQKGDLSGFGVIAGAHQESHGGARCGQGPFKFQRRDHVGMVGVMIAAVLCGIKRLETRGQDHRAHFDLKVPELNRPLISINQKNHGPPDARQNYPGHRDFLITLNFS